MIKMVASLGNNYASQGRLSAGEVYVSGRLKISGSSKLGFQHYKRDTGLITVLYCKELANLDFLTC